MVSSIYDIFPGVVFNDALFLFRFIYKVLRGLPGGSWVKNPPAMQETKVWSLD